MKRPLTNLKPQLISWVVLIRSLPITLRLATVGSALGGTAAFMMTLLQYAHYTLWWPFLYCGGAVFVAVPLVILFIYKRTYVETEYKFYDDYLEYTEGFWVINHKTIAYRHISQVNMRRGVIQRLYGLGSIYLAVPSGIVRHGSYSGIMIHDIKEPEKVYASVQQILSNER